jgi:hypothetical protein
MTSDDRILASPELADQIPDIQLDQIDILSTRMALVVADRVVAGKQLPITGILVSVLFDAKPEIEIKVQIDDALSVVEVQKQHFNSFEIHKGERVVPLAGPFTVTAARIQDIDVKTEMCVLSMQLERQAKKS